jgi:hypothetical protein
MIAICHGRCKISAKTHLKFELNRELCSIHRDSSCKVGAKTHFKFELKPRALLYTQTHHDLYSSIDTLKILS